MWSVGSAVVKMKRSMISVRDDDLSNFKFPWGRGKHDPVRTPVRSGVFCPRAPHLVALAASLVGVCTQVGIPSGCKARQIMRARLHDCLWATRGSRMAGHSTQLGYGAWACMHSTTCIPVI